MIHNNVQRTSIFLGDEDRAAIRAIQERYGVSTDSDAIRLALRVLAQAKEIGLSPLPEARPRKIAEENAASEPEGHDEQAARSERRDDLRA
jgi:hypothetical protein